VLPDIRSQTPTEIQALLGQWGEPAFRAGQLLRWVYEELATDWEQMSNIPAALRARLRQEFSIAPLHLLRVQGARDSTRKFLWQLADKALVESVLIPASPALYGEASDRHTLCVSTQVGCAYGCKFCASGLLGWKRNLTAGEIVDQVLAIERQNRSEEGAVASKAFVPARLVSNLVIMGMGEPLANYDNLLRALRILNAPWGRGIGARKITISSSGLAPQIRKLADEPLQFRLAISLHGATDATRSRIMPINRKHPLAELTEACEYYQAKKGKMITFEYILIAGVNDGEDQPRPLATLARRLHAKINLIPYNHVEGLAWERPSEARQKSFLAALERLGASVTLRLEKGHDIDAACGQLRLKTERELSAATQGSLTSSR
jgi:23S rRNA (adenine2503-C2)-methyltransferase